VGRQLYERVRNVRRGRSERLPFLNNPSEEFGHSCGDSCEHLTLCGQNSGWGVSDQCDGAGWSCLHDPAGLFVVHTMAPPDVSRCAIVSVSHRRKVTVSTKKCESRLSFFRPVFRYHESILTVSADIIHHKLASFSRSAALTRPVR